MEHARVVVLHSLVTRVLISWRFNFNFLVESLELSLLLSWVRHTLFKVVNRELNPFDQYAFLKDAFLAEKTG